MSSGQIQDLKNRFEKYLKILNLKNEKILLLTQTYGESAISRDNANWKIEYNINHPEYELVHEIGHIFLYIKINYEYFADPPDNIKSSIFNNQRLMLFFNYCNSLVDCFVDYNISVYSKFFNLFLDYLKEILNGMTNIQPQSQSEQLVEGYLKFYPSFNQILRKTERDKLKNKIENAIELVRNEIINKNPLYSEDIFNELNMELNKFSSIKKTSDHQQILNFLKFVTKKLPEFDNNYVDKNLLLIFPKS